MRQIQEYSFYQQFITADNINFYRTKPMICYNASTALVTSGTATLETALFKVPEVVCYKGNGFRIKYAKRIITLKYIFACQFDYGQRGRYRVDSRRLQHKRIASNYKNLSLNIEKLY